jgi:hypothetical protein
VKPDIVAPGNHVVSLLAPGSTLAGESQNQVPLSYYQSTRSTAASTKYLMLNGTSMATPVVTGAVADMLQGQPSLTPDQVKARLMKTAYKTFPTSSTAVDPLTGQSFVSQYDIMTIGAGYLDIAAALANKDVATGSAMSPIAYYDSKSGNVYLAYDPSSTWDDTDTYSVERSAAPAVFGVPRPCGELWLSTPAEAYGEREACGAPAPFPVSRQSGELAAFGAPGVFGVRRIRMPTEVSGGRVEFGVPTLLRPIPIPISAAISKISRDARPRFTGTRFAGMERGLCAITNCRLKSTASMPTEFGAAEMQM